MLILVDNEAVKLVVDTDIRGSSHSCFNDIPNREIAYEAYNHVAESNNLPQMGDIN